MPDEVGFCRYSPSPSFGDSEADEFLIVIEIRIKCKIMIKNWRLVYLTNRSKAFAVMRCTRGSGPCG